MYWPAEKQHVDQVDGGLQDHDQRHGRIAAQHVVVTMVGTLVLAEQGIGASRPSTLKLSGVKVRLTAHGVQLLIGYRLLNYVRLTHGTWQILQSGRTQPMRQNQPTNRGYMSVVPKI